MDRRIPIRRVDASPVAEAFYEGLVEKRGRDPEGFETLAGRLRQAHERQTVAERAVVIRNGCYLALCRAGVVKYDEPELWLVTLLTECETPRPERDRAWTEKAFALSRKLATVEMSRWAKARMERDPRYVTDRAKYGEAWAANAYRRRHAIYPFPDGLRFPLAPQKRTEFRDVLKDEVRDRAHSRAGIATDPDDLGLTALSAVDIEARAMAVLEAAQEFAPPPLVSYSPRRAFLRALVPDPVVPLTRRFGVRPLKVEIVRRAATLYLADLVPDKDEIRRKRASIRNPAIPEAGSWMPCARKVSLDVAKGASRPAATEISPRTELALAQGEQPSWVAAIPHPLSSEDAAREEIVFEQYVDRVAADELDREILARRAEGARRSFVEISRDLGRSDGFAGQRAHRMRYRALRVREIREAREDVVTNRPFRGEEKVEA